MIQLGDEETIGSALHRAADVFGELPLVAAPHNPNRDYHPLGYELTYQNSALAVEELARQYLAAGYGPGHRVGLFLDNRPEHFVHKLALNVIGACCVPVNPEYRASELAYLIDHAKLDLIVLLAVRRTIVESVLMTTFEKPVLVEIDQFEALLRSPRRRREKDAVRSSTSASILYTSGTTGRPKGCVLSHRYELAAGAWYASRGHLAEVRERSERLYNALPLYHVNASVLSFFCMLLTGGCQIQSDRFQPSRWWQEVRQSHATIIHHLGVIVPLLLDQPESELDRMHSVRFGFGAGVEPQLQAKFEKRFGFPLLEIWGMTEIVRVLVDNVPPRCVGSRAFGPAVPGLQVKVVDDAGNEAGLNAPGEMLVRHSEAQPRKDFFTGYLDDPEATESAWKDGWFHTGDVVVKDESGMLHFVDRRKNIIRRSGENIAAAEVEALLMTHPLIEHAAVLAVKDELREEEVLACVVLIAGVRAQALDNGRRVEIASEVHDFCRERLAYYKAPGWILFKGEIPKTGTQKIQKHNILSSRDDPRHEPGIVDLRDRKKRIATSASGRDTTGANNMRLEART
ncbi:crotonobetaine/carnitine-CoA ligase [Polaromonas sp. OV174]|uniref:AMP-binding protein n=1 Tax=Polaromonas sp. OV174 TaxID=1855300 RepID=UPI0008F225C2|nr:AMP-binding protein [Polaromonas sp. OV174]SFC21878.1 crotonobetaine/carnitine-CoA ligase [Polaromonas sp. OV174]